ncbi:MAG TPA: asparagine--tRNA ligase, partial [Thermoplasmata archaeon]|nr:asparagine--tRNA ligase [Thermoplasmata archaeon]
MTDPVPISEVFERPPGKIVRIRGWIYRTRGSGGIRFIVVRDSTGIVQTTATADGTKGFPEAAKALVETSLVVEGEVVEDERAPGGREVRATRIEILGPAEPFPISRDESEEFLLDIRHLWLRSREMTAIMKIRSTVFDLFRGFFRERGFHEAHAPIFVGGAVEGGSTLFEVRYFDRKVYLTQSWQLYAEAMIYSLENIFTIAPTFRAEKSRTRRHLTEFWMAEVECAWTGNEAMMSLGEELVTHLVHGVAERHRPELEILKRDPAALRRI